MGFGYIRGTSNYDVSIWNEIIWAKRDGKPLLSQLGGALICPKYSEGVAGHIRLVLSE